jgi:hypothetical protein
MFNDLLAWEADPSPWGDIIAEQLWGDTFAELPHAPKRLLTRVGLMYYVPRPVS